MPKLEESITVINKKGLHARPAALLVQLICKHQSQVNITFDGQTVNAKSIMGILTLGAQSGSVLHFIVDGEDASTVMVAIKEFLSKQEEEMNL